MTRKVKKIIFLPQPKAFRQPTPGVLFLIIVFLTVVSCRQPQKAKALMEEAIDIYMSRELPENIRIERSLELTNRALKFDDRSLSALTHKATLSFRKRDMDGLLQTADELIELNPDKPYYLMQKAFYLGLKGDSALSNEYYERATNMYQDYLKRDSLDFDLLIEYATLFESRGDTERVFQILARMDTMEFEDYRKDILSAYRMQVSNQSHLWDKLRKFWNGEISYEELEEYLSQAEDQEN